MAFKPVTEAEVLLLREVIIKTLGLPRERCGVVFVIDEEDDEGRERRHIGCLGLTEAGLAVTLYDALQEVMTRTPDRQETIPTGKPV